MKSRRRANAQVPGMLSSGLDTKGDVCLQTEFADKTHLSVKQMYGQHAAKRKAFCRYQTSVAIGSSALWSFKFSPGSGVLEFDVLNDICLNGVMR